MVNHAIIELTLRHLTSTLRYGMTTCAPLRGVKSGGRESRGVGIRAPTPPRPYMCTCARIPLHLLPGTGPTLPMLTIELVFGAIAALISILTAFANLINKINAISLDIARLNSEVGHISSRQEDSRRTLDHLSKEIQNVSNRSFGTPRSRNTREDD